MTNIVRESSAYLETSSKVDIGYEGFIVSKVYGTCNYHWVHIHGVDPLTGSPASALLEMCPSLERLLGGAGFLPHVCSQLRSAPNVELFLAGLQDTLERLQHASTAASGTSSGGSSSRLMALLLRDLDVMGWGCLEDLDQDATRLTLLHRDRRSREHRLRLNLPHTYPNTPPTAATDLPAPFSFGWDPPSQRATALGRAGAAGNLGEGRKDPPAYNNQHHSGSGAICSSIADVFECFKKAVAGYQALWACLDELDRRTRVLDPSPTISAARRHLRPPSRRLAMGSTGHSSMQLRLDPADPTGPPAASAVVFLGPPEEVAALWDALTSRLQLWNRDSGLVDNLELVLGQPLPPPYGAHAAGQVPGGVGSCAEALPECPICMMHLLPVAGQGEGGEEAMEAAYGVAGGGVGAGGLAPDVVCPTPACSLAFHTPCLSEWLRSVPDTQQVFHSLFGRCPFCNNPITVRAQMARGYTL